jgi:hypothetical protein
MKIKVLGAFGCLCDILCGCNYLCFSFVPASFFCLSGLFCVTEDQNITESTYLTLRDGGFASSNGGQGIQIFTFSARFRMMNDPDLGPRRFGTDLS